MLISNAYREMNRNLHETRDDYGRSGGQWAPIVKRIVEADGHKSVLDWGCGKGTLLANLGPIKGVTLAEYDPAIAGKDVTPEPADLVVCTDVLEHIERGNLNAVIRELLRLTKRKLFFNVCVRPSTKLLPDGRNSHLTLKPVEWWREKLDKDWHILVWDVRHDFVFGEAVPRKVPRPVGFKRPTKRRPPPPQLTDMFDHIRKAAARYNDAFNKIQTIRMWEGVGDEPADMQCAANIIEHWPNPDDALREMCSLAYKAVMLAITIGDGRSPQDWRMILSQRLRIAEWYGEGHGLINQILVIGSPMVNVGGVRAVGAVSSDDRWAQIEQITKRITKRIEPAPPHARRAIVACYGPSLESTLGLLRKEREDTGALLVSVSGAHDFLVSHGIIPDVHVECDPRQHKADNIDKAIPGVSYWLASCVSPSLIDKLGPEADIRLWHVSTQDHAVKLIDGMGEHQNLVISGGGSVGLRSIPLLYAHGYRDVSVYAMDCSFSDNGEKQWAGRHFGKRQQLCRVACGSRIFISSPTLASYATNFWETVQKVNDLDVRLYGDGLLQAMARHYMGIPEPSKEEQAA